MKHFLEADSIRLQLNGRSILSGVYLKCETGKITGLLGRNGQGKSCLLRAIYGSQSCERSIRFNGRVEYEAFRYPDLVRYLPQFSFIPGSLRLKRVFSDFESDFDDFAGRFAEFSGRANATMRSLSGGAQRLVSLYVLACSKAQFVLLDEPFTHLDPLHIEKVKELLVEIKREKGLLVTDHLFRHIMELSDELYLLKDGQTYRPKSPEDLERFGYARL